MILVRRVVGNSMEPTLMHGQIIVAIRKSSALRVGDVVVIRHQGMEKIKRITQLKPGAVFVAGDNQAHSTDSRHFGWLERSLVVGKIIYPRLNRKLY